jgi:hypothetical protein
MQKYIAVIEFETDDKKQARDTAEAIATAMDGTGVTDYKYLVKVSEVKDISMHLN